MSKKKPTALVTGASGGIGRELARQLARNGHDVVIVARNREKLAATAVDFGLHYEANVVPIVCDLAHRDAAATLADELVTRKLEIDTLINNAGFATYGPFRDTKLEEELQMLQVNIVALTQLTKLLLPAMLERRTGKIMNVASTAAFAPGPLMAVYYATKAYVLSFSEALGNELQDSGITVTALCPGPTKSGFQERAGMESSRLLRGEIMDAATVARAGYRGLMRGESVVIPGATNRGFALLARLLPRRAVVNIVRRAQEAG